MARVHVISSVIAWIDYDPKHRTLDVGFKHGRAYRYLAVPKKVYDSFLAAPSKGTFFGDHIRDAYLFARL